MPARISITLPAGDGEENDEEIPQRPPLSPSLANSGTPLDRTIDKIGMGRYQYTLLALCGLGWAADNMWLQAIAIALPRVQVHYDVISTSIGYLSAAIFAGMMIGALMWGTLSDLLGRATVFNLTLFFTAIFGFFTYLVDSFLLLCLASFFLGTAVGGSMPTDGTFALETLPRKKRHLLTSLSVFFSLGSVMAAIAALIVIPTHSCPPVRHDTSLRDEHGDCDVQKRNNGWKYLFLILSGITFFMFIARILFFRLYESPRFLVHAGRKEDAAEALSEIAKFNGFEFTVTVAEVNDDGEAEDPIARPTSYHATESDYIGAADIDAEEDRLLSGISHPRPHHRRMSTASMLSTTSRRKVNRIVPKWIRNPILEWFRRIESLLYGDWRQRTLLIWAIWGNMAFAYTMFNVFLPTLLEYRANDGNSHSDAETSLDGPLWEVLLFTLAGTPGAPLGAYLVDAAPRRGLSKSFLLSIITLITGIFCLIFVMVTGYYTIMISTMGMSLSSTAMWSILYGMTPELFATEVRGTASGTASALSRIGGVIAPLVGSVLVSINPILVCVVSVVIFILTAFLLVLLDRNLKRTGHSTHQMSEPPRYEAIDPPSPAIDRRRQERS